jgi:hypothetical protein
MLNDTGTILRKGDARKGGTPELKAFNRPSFLDSLNIRHEPRARLGRYFLLAEAAMQQRGLRVSFITPAELAETNTRHLASWGPLLPVVDCRINDLRPEDMICLGAYDSSGALVSCMAVRRMRIDNVLKSEMESLAIFYGAAAPAKRATDQFEISAPAASSMRGIIAYLAALWVHPKERHGALSVAMSDLIRFVAIATWNPNFEATILTNKFLRPDIAEAYAFHATEPGFVYRRDGRVIWQGVFAWSDRAALHRTLEAKLAGLEPAPSIDVRRGQKVQVVAAHER